MECGTNTGTRALLWLKQCVDQSQVMNAISKLVIVCVAAEHSGVVLWQLPGPSGVRLTSMPRSAWCCA